MLANVRTGGEVLLQQEKRCFPCVKTSTHLYDNSSVCMIRESIEVHSGIRSQKSKRGRAHVLKGFGFLRKAAIQ